MSYNRKRAFVVAQQFAAQNWLEASALGNFEATNNAIGEVETALGATYETDIEKWLKTNVANQKTAADISDAVTEQRCAAQEAGFLYGLALGLTLGRGGPQ